MAAVDLLDRIATEDEEYGSEGESRQNKKKSKHGYETVNLENEVNGHKTRRNPFDEINSHFAAEEDPESYVKLYHDIRMEIESIQNNINSVSKLRDSFMLSSSQSEYSVIMSKLDDIMMDNSQVSLRIKNRLKTEKAKNDKLESSGDHTASTILQYRINQLNSCVRAFKSFATEFEKQLSDTQNALKQKEIRKLREFDENNELCEEKIDFYVENPNQLEAFLQKKFEGMAAADALLDRVQELEDRHAGMIKIEKSIRELHQLWVELTVMVDDTGHQLDLIQANVEKTREYMKKAVPVLQSAEKKQKMSRKMACCAVCLLLIIVIVCIIIFLPGFI